MRASLRFGHSIKDNALSACPTCGSKVQRLISANVGFVFKGSGFYQNEYKNPPVAGQASSPSADIPKASTDKTPEPKPSVDAAPRLWNLRESRSLWARQ